MITINPENTANVTAFLTALWTNINSGEHSGISGLVAKHKLPTFTSAVIKHGGVAISNGVKGPGARWTWNTKMPDDQMAVELIRRLNNYVKPAKPVQIAPKVTRTPLETKPADKSEKNCVETAIELLKSMGYKILRPEYVEV